MLIKLSIFCHLPSLYFSWLNVSSEQDLGAKGRQVFWILPRLAKSHFLRRGGQSLPPALIYFLCIYEYANMQSRHPPPPALPSTYPMDDGRRRRRRQLQERQCRRLRCCQGNAKALSRDLTIVANMWRRDLSLFFLRLTFSRWTVSGDRDGEGAPTLYCIANVSF